MQEFTETLGTDGVNPRHPSEDAPAASVRDARFRIGLVSLLAALIGLAAGFIAYVLYLLIGFFTNFFFFHRLSFAFSSARNNHLGMW